MDRGFDFHAWKWHSDLVSMKEKCIHFGIDYQTKIKKYVLYRIAGRHLQHRNHRSTANVMMKMNIFAEKKYFAGLWRYGLGTTELENVCVTCHRSSASALGHRKTETWHNDWSSVCLHRCHHHSRRSLPLPSKLGHHRGRWKMEMRFNDWLKGCLHYLIKLRCRSLPLPSALGHRSCRPKIKKKFSDWIRCDKTDRYTK